MLVNLQALRFLAALPVLAYHIAPHVWASGIPRGGLLDYVQLFGFGGVDVFFVISGFIISYITWERPFASRRFALRRFLRIVPLYVFFTFLAVLAVLLNPAWDSKGVLDAGYVLRSFLIIPMQGTPYLGVGWSLEHELLFYAITGVLLATGRARWLPGVLGLLFAIGVVLHAGMHVPGRTRWDFHLFSPFHFSFLVGVLVFRLRSRLGRLGSALPLALGAAGFAVTSALVGPEPSTSPTGWIGVARVVGYGLASGLLLTGALNAERAGRLAGGGSPLRGLWWIGEASYVLYLSHFFVYSILAKVYAALGVPESLELPALAGALLAAVGFAVAFHVSLERPFLAWARRRA